ncbi:MAG TPA: hypothetical protein VK516_10575 [Gemmatimonadaceae bacterium]|nr:hypothetical protein [Gemmatimonadaceae bacterium]
MSHCSLVKCPAGFGLDDKLPVDNHIQPLTRNIFTLVQDRHGHFATDIMAAIV